LRGKKKGGRKRDGTDELKRKKENEKKGKEVNNEEE